MEYRILGSIEVEADGGSAEIPRGKQRALLAMLLLHRNQVVSADELIMALWGDRLPAGGVRTLRFHVSKLRDTLARIGARHVLATRDGGYLLLARDDEVDASRFESLLVAARRTLDDDPVRARAMLIEGLALWRGRALADVQFDEFATGPARYLEEQQRGAVELRLALDVALDGAEGVMAELLELRDADPLHEPVTALLMRALYKTGRQAEALAAYRDLRRRLGEGLGIEPSLELRELERLIVVQDPGLTVQVRATGPVHNLPRPRDSFVGRERQVVEIGEVVTGGRCVTLTGAGGSGKTRLAVEAARRLLGEHPSGARWVELATITDPEALGEHVLLAFGDPGSHTADPVQLLVDLLAPRRLLLVLDNCEHLVAAVARLVDRLLEGCPDLAILATSRGPLGIAGEVVLHVETLEVPTDGEPVGSVATRSAVRLLVDRVRSHRRDFMVDESNANAVGSICRHLDGMPLAIELAAARLRTMDADRLAARIDDRFALLTGASRTAPARHQTLRAAIAWSHDLLGDEAQQMFRRLSVFAGPWTLEAAHGVGGDDTSRADTVALMDELVDKSLVETVAGSRFRLLETVRSFARDQVAAHGEVQRLERRHRDWFLEMVRRERTGLYGHDQQAAWGRLEEDHDNLRAAIQWSLEHGEPDAALEMVAGLGFFWLVRGYWREAWRWLERSLAAEGATPLIRARAITDAGLTEVFRVNFKAVRGVTGEARAVMERHGDEAGLLRLDLLESIIAYYDGSADARARLEAAYRTSVERGDSWSAAVAARYLGSAAETEAEAIPPMTRSFELFSSLGDRWNAAFSLYTLSAWYNAYGRFEEGAVSGRRARDLSAEIGDVIWYAHAVTNLGVAAYWLTDRDEARRHFEAALDRLGSIGDDACLVIIHGYLANLDLAVDETASALEHTIEAMRSALRIGATVRGAVGLCRAAAVAVAVDDVHEAARLLGAGKRFLEDGNYPLGPVTWDEIAATQQRITEVFGKDRFAVIVTEPENLTLPEVLAEGLRWAEERLVALSVPAIA